MVRTTPQERGTRWYRELVTDDPKHEESDINHFELPLLMFSLWASFSSSRQKRSEGWQEATLLLLPAHKSGCHLHTPGILSPWQLMISSSRAPGVPNRMQESCSVRAGTSRVCTPGVCTALKVRLLLSAHIQSEQMNLCVSVFYTSRQEAGNSASEVDLSIFPEILGCNEVLYMFWFFRGHW